MNWQLINAIKNRLDRPEEIPGKSIVASYQEDVRALLEELNRIYNELQEAKYLQRNRITGKYL